MELYRDLDDERENLEIDSALSDTSESQFSIFREIEREFDENMEEVEVYQQSERADDCPPNPVITYLNQEIFGILLDILERTLYKAIETSSLECHKTPFNPMDFIAEQLWNLNPKYPERRESWVSVFDTEWAKKDLKKNPRPFFPLSWIWSKEYAVLKIQSYMRGYWIRRREDVQEVRQFWKALQEDKYARKELGYLKPKLCECHNKEEKCAIHTK
ncbi:hypothetical protein Trydic_g16875 [Trypoxylus dichotomus]